MITTVVFDLDDTLYDEIDYCRSGFWAVAGFLAEQPKRPPAERIFDCLWEQFTAGNRKTTFNCALEKIGIGYDEQLIAELVKTYRSHTPDITLPDDSRELIEKLHGLYKLALLTDGFLPAQQLKVQALGIEKHFDCIVYTEQLGREFWKPSPVGFEKIMQELNAGPQQIVYIADNPQKDFIAPNKLGFMTVQINRPGRIHTCSAKEPDRAAHYVIQKITQLPELFG